MDIVGGKIGSQVGYDVSFSGGKLVISLGDPALGLVSSVSVDEKLVLDAIVKLMPAGSSMAKIAGMVVSVVEAATSNL